MNTGAKATLVIGSIIVAAGVYIASKSSSPSAPSHPPPYNYCVDSVYYTRSCETSPFSVAAGTPGYAGQICGAHTYAWRGDDLFTYAILDQDFHTPYQGRTYPRPPNSAGAQAQAVWDQCYVLHQSLGGGYPCTANGPSGTQAYVTRTWAQLPDGPQKTAWGNLYGCFNLTPSPSLTPVPATPVPTMTPGGPPTPIPTCQPCIIVVTATPSPHFATAVPRTPTKVAEIWKSTEDPNFKDGRDADCYKAFSYCTNCQHQEGGIVTWGDSEEARRNCWLRRQTMLMLTASKPKPAPTGGVK